MIPDRAKGAVFLPVGLCLLAAAGAVGRDRLRFLAQSETAPGVVAAERYGPANVDVRFAPRGGEPLTYMQNGMIFVHRGDRVTVRYDSREPRRSAALDRFGALWGDVLSLGGLGSVFASAGALLLVRRPFIPDVGWRDRLRTRVRA